MYNQKPFNGTAFANNKSGALLYEKDFENGKEIKNRNYYATITDSIPHLKFETQIKDGKRNGLRRGWYHSGELMGVIKIGMKMEILKERVSSKWESKWVHIRIGLIMVN